MAKKIAPVGACEEKRGGGGARLPLRSHQFATNPCNPPKNKTPPTRPQTTSLPPSHTHRHPRRRRPGPRRRPRGARPRRPRPRPPRGAADADCAAVGAHRAARPHAQRDPHPQHVPGGPGVLGAAGQVRCLFCGDGRRDGALPLCGVGFRASQTNARSLRTNASLSPLSPRTQLQGHQGRPDRGHQEDGAWGRVDGLRARHVRARSRVAAFIERGRKNLSTPHLSCGWFFCPLFPTAPFVPSPPFIAHSLPPPHTHTQ